jgi:hypothetical protein
VWLTTASSPLRQADLMELLDPDDAGLTTCDLGDPPIHLVCLVWLRLVSVCATFVNHTPSVPRRALRAGTPM